MKRSFESMAVSAFALFFASSSQAALVNPGFETGDLTGWTATLDFGTANVVTSHSTTYGGNATYLPTHGLYFLAIASGSADIWQTVTQTVQLAANGSLSGMAAFNWGDYTPYEDGVRVRILDGAGGELAVPFYMDGTMAPVSGYNGPWTAWSWTALLDGLYTVEYGVRNTIDSGGPEQTHGYFDTYNNEIPEPASLALLGLGLAGLAALRRRKYA